MQVPHLRFPRRTRGEQWVLRLAGALVVVSLSGITTACLDSQEERGQPVEASDHVAPQEAVELPAGGSLGGSPEQQCPCGPEEDCGAPGPCAAEVVQGSNEEAGWRTVYAYDANGHPVREATDWDGDGEPDEVVIRQVGGNGRVLRRFFDSDGDDQPDSFDYRWTFRGDLQVLRELDRDGDGTIDESVQYYYDETGLLVREDQFIKEVSGIFLRWTYSYDQAGILRFEESDSGGDGTIDGRVTHTYGARDRLTMSEWDVGPDGDVDVRWSSEYDSCGRLAKWITDHFADGTPERVEAYAYDAVGNLVGESFDDPADGNIDWRRRYDFGCWP